MKDISDMFRQRTRKSPRSNHWKKGHEDAIHCASYKTIDIWPFDICMCNQDLPYSFYLRCVLSQNITTSEVYNAENQRTGPTNPMKFLPPHKNNTQLIQIRRRNGWRSRCDVARKYEERCHCSAHIIPQILLWELLPNHWAKNNIWCKFTRFSETSMQT